MATAAPARQVMRRQRAKTTPVSTMADHKDVEGHTPWDTGKRYALAATGTADVK